MTLLMVLRLVLSSFMILLADARVLRHVEEAEGITHPFIPTPYTPGELGKALYPAGNYPKLYMFS